MTTTAAVHQALPFPTYKVLILASISMGNSASYVATYPFVAFMVLSFFGDLPEASVGYYTGMLEGSYHLGAFVGAIFWGVYADRYGRRPALLYGLVGTIFSCLLFGTAKSYAVAILGRVCWGALNGNVGVVKVCLSEITDDEHTPRAFSWIGVATGAGRVIGPAVGGLLSQPASKYPALFGGVTLFIEFPFLLPCLVTATMTACTLIPAYFVLEETLPSVTGVAGVATIADTAAAKPLELQPLSPLPATGLNGPTASAVGGRKALPRGGVAAGVSVEDSHTTYLEVDNSEDDEEAGVIRVDGDGGAGAGVAIRATPDDEFAPAARSFRSRSRGNSSSYSNVSVSAPTSTTVAAASTNGLHGLPDDDENDEEEDELQVRRAGKGGRDIEMVPLVGRASNSPSSMVTPPPPPPSSSTTFWGTTRRLLSDRPIASAVALYSALGLVGMVSAEVFPLYVLVAPEHGGFNWTSTEIGLVAMEAGAPLIIFQAFFYDRLARWMGLLRLSRWSLGLFTLALLVTPACSLTLLASPAVQFSVISIHFALTTLVRVSAFTCVFVFVSNSALPLDRGKVNGLGQALVSLCRMVGPPIFTGLYAWSIADPRPFPFNFAFTWLLMAGLAGGTLAITYTLPPWIERKRVA